MPKSSADPVTEAERDALVQYFANNGVSQEFIDSMLAQYGPVETWNRANMATVLNQAIILLGESA